MAHAQVWPFVNKKLDIRCVNSYTSPNARGSLAGVSLFRGGDMMQAVQPRGLRRTGAAAYLGISTSLFDRERAAGRIPAPRQMFGVALWDRHHLDSLFDGKPAVGGIVADNDNASDYWDRECAIPGSRNT